MVKWVKRGALATGALLLLLWVSAWLAVPPLLKWQLETRLPALLGRSVTVGELSVRPWALELSASDLVLGAPIDSPAGTAAAAPAAAQPAEPLLRIARLRANLAFWPLLERVLVIEALELDAPRLSVARLAAGRYDVDDLIERFGKAEAQPGAEPGRFELHQLQVSNAQLRFDDRPVRRVHSIDALQLSLPFLSNRPEQAGRQVEPRLAFRLNGVPFDSSAQATPFADPQQALLTLKLSELDVAPYLDYLPRALPLRPTRGLLSADLSLAYRRSGGAAPSLSLRGTLGARDLALNQADGTPLLAWRRLQLGLRDVQPLAHRLAFDALRIEGAQLQLARDAAGRLKLPQGAAGAQGEGAAAPWQLSLDALELADARLLWKDAAVRPAAALQLDGLSLVAKQLQWPAERPASLSLTATLREPSRGAGSAGRLTVQGTASPRAAKLNIAVADLTLGALAPYAAQALQPRVEGRLAAQTVLDWSASAEAPRLQLAVERATLDMLRLRPGPGRPDAAGLAQLALADAQIDLRQRSATLGSVKLTRPFLQLERDAEGRLNAAQWLRGTPSGQDAPATKTAAEAPWRLQLRSLQLQGGQLQLVDAFVKRRPHARPLRAELQQLQLALQDFVWSGERALPAAKLQFSARVGSPATAREKAQMTGTLDWRGAVGLRPLQANGRARVTRFPAHLFAPYFAELLPVSLLRAEAGYSGSLALREQAAGLALAAQGDVLLGDVHLSALPDAGDPAELVSGADELLSWQSFALKRVAFEMKPGQRPRLDIGEAALTDFYSRLVVTEQGHFNLRDVGMRETPGQDADAAPPPQPPDGLPLDISVGATKLNNGRIDFSDHFVRPNYSAELTELNGALGAFSSTQRDMATLQLRGRAAGTALLSIDGQINPGVRPLALDIKARATDLELAPLSPYAGKYAGYAIERGKLSLDVAYKVEADGKLQANNQLVLNQLTFGERIESPSATKLPVLLAVALLKDRHGVIDINLPISGSVNDPKFSVGSIIFKLIVNLIGKALTAPFSLLFGSEHQDLSAVEFRPGTAQLAEASAAAVDKVAKALAERPALQMTVTGSADLERERADYQREAIEARLLAERRREGLRAGAAANAPVTLSTEQRARLLKALYRRTELPDKPRNVLGFAKDLPEDEMEALLRKHVPVTAETMLELALQRGLAVRDALIAKGLASERLFVAAPKLHVPDDDKPGWTPQAELSLAVK